MEWCFGRCARRLTVTGFSSLFMQSFYFYVTIYYSELDLFFIMPRKGQCCSIRCTCIDYYFVYAGIIWCYINDVDGASNKYVSCVIDNNVKITNALI